MKNLWMINVDDDAVKPLEFPPESEGEKTTTVVIVSREPTAEEGRLLILAALGCPDRSARLPMDGLVGRLTWYRGCYCMLPDWCLWRVIGSRWNVASSPAEKSEKIIAEFFEVVSEYFSAATPLVSGTRCL